MRVLCVALMLFAACGLRAEPTPTPPVTPRIELFAEFTANTRCPVYEESDEITLWLKVAGRRLIDDTLSWSLVDVEGRSRGKGLIPVPKGDAAWESLLKIPKTPCGYFEVYLKLEKAEITIPRAGSRPEGFVSFAVLPKIERLPLPSVDASRFGGQGTNFVKSGEFMKGDFVDPVYPVIGMKWIYRNRRLAELCAAGPDAYVPVLDPDKMREQGKWSCERAAGLCLLVDAHSIPAWLTKYPDNVKPSGGVEPTVGGQAYPPNDFEKYGKLIGAVAAEQALNRKVNYPNQKRNYYEIHWEPDWHWKGTDEDFIDMYAAAHKAIRENDPDGMLLGVNYGVLTTGNKHLERLFAKGLGDHLDGIVTHTYFVPEFQTPEKGHLPQEMRKLVALTRKYLKPGAPIINSEWGAHNGSYPPIKYHWALKDEAARFMRGHLATLGEGADATFFFYTADCGLGGGGLFFNLTYPNPVYGATHLAPKPVAAAAAFATRLLDGTTSIGALEYLGENILGYAFDRGGRVVASVWTTNGEEREIMLPTGMPEVICYDPMGNAKTRACENGFIKVKIGPLPSYVIGLSRGAVPGKAIKTSEAKVLPGGGLKVVEAVRGENVTYQISAAGTAINLGQGPTLKIPRSASSGVWLLAAVDGKNGEWLGGLAVDIAPAVVIEMSSLGIFKLSNTGADALKGMFTVGAENGKMLFNKEVELPPSASALVDTGSQLMSASADAATLTVTFTDNFKSVSRGSVALPSSCFARKGGASPVIDANFDEWQLEQFQTLSGLEALKVSSDGVYGGDADLSFRFAIQYDENALYVAIKARDDSHCQEQSDADSWKEDSVQLGVALHSVDGAWKLFHKFCFALSNKGNGGLMGFRHNGTPELPAGKLTQEAVRYAVSRKGDETYYEIAIPWQSLDPSLKGIPTERVVGVGIFVNDVDVVNGTKSKRKAMEAFGGMGYTIPKDFGKVFLR